MDKVRIELISCQNSCCKMETATAHPSGGIPFSSISPKQIPGINLLSYIFQTVIIPVGNDTVTLGFKLIQIIDHFTAKKGRPIIQCGFVNNNLSPYCFDPFHDALNGTLAEILTCIYRDHDKSLIKSTIRLCNSSNVIIIILFKLLRKFSNAEISFSFIEASLPIIITHLGITTLNGSGFELDSI